MRLEGAARIYAPVLAVLGLVLLLSVANRPLYAHHGAAPGASGADGARYRLDAASARSSGATYLSGDLRRAGFSFETGTAPADRQVFLDAVAAARPEARQLIGLVDGLVEVRIGPTGTPGAIGLTQGVGTGLVPSRYRVTIDLGLVAARYGPRGIDRTRPARARPRRRLRAGHRDDARASTPAPARLGCDDGMLAPAPTPGALRRELRQVGNGRHRRQSDIGYKVPPPSPT